MRRLRVAAVQIDTTVGDLDGNVQLIVDAYAEAVGRGAQLVVFPELALTGYPPEDLLLKPGFVDEAAEALDKVAAATGSAAAVVGYPLADRDLYNAAAVCAGGSVVGSYRKRLLPNYAVFDEQRYFVPGDGSGPIFDIGGVRVGVTICEDVWSPTGPVLDQAVAGAEVAVNINASPYYRDKASMRESMLATRAADAGIPLVYCNLVGGQDELVFDGGSVVFDADGKLVARARQFHPDVLVVDLEVRGTFRQRQLDPRGRDRGPTLPALVVPAAAPPVDRPLVARIEPHLPDLDEVYEALVVGTRDYVTKNGFDDVVIGLSGGIDSSLTAAVAVDALGADHVHGLSMPSRFSSEGSVTDAERLADNLGIDLRIIPIEAAHETIVDMLAPAFAGTGPGVAEENVQSRIRGLVWMALSNKFGWLVLTCSNKSEAAVGYATLYGDTAGGYSVIKDVPKLLVYDLARRVNQRAGRDVIPQAVIDKPPSAELRPDQRDDQSLPPYEVLDPILEAYVERDLTAEEITALGHDPAVVERICRLVDLSEYKRRQSPPGPRISEKAFGRDRRLPITNRFR